MQVLSGWRKHRRLTTYVALAVVVLALAVVVLRQPWKSSDPDRAAGDPSPSDATSEAAQDPEELLDSAEATSPVAPDAPADPDTAQEVVTQLVTRASTLLADVDPDGNTDVASLRSVATGPALGELLAQVQEYEVEDWQQRGATTLVWTRVVDRRSTQEELFVKACLDTSDVSIRDANGVRILRKEPGRRDVNHYLLRRTAQGWKVAEHSFPARTDC